MKGMNKKQKTKDFSVIVHRTFSDYKDWWVFFPGAEKTPENLEKYKDSPWIFDGGYNGGSPAEMVESWLDETVKTKETDYFVEINVTIRKATKADYDKVTR